MTYEDRQIMNGAIETMRTTDDRGELISQIEGLYPADSGYDQNSEIGKRFLDEAREEARVSWRDESLPVLRLYAEKCIRKDWEGV